MFYIYGHMLRLTTILFLYALLLCQLLSAQQGNFTNFSVHDGLAQSQVYAIAEDESAHLWLGTRGGGLCRFDGTEFEVFTTRDGLPSNYILQLFRSNQGLLWIGTSDGLSIYDGHAFKNLILDKSGKNMIVGAFAEDAKGRIWAGTNHGLYIVDNEEVTQVPLTSRQFAYAISCIEPDPFGGMWVGSDAGLLYIKNDKIDLYTRRDGLSSNYIRCLEYDEHGYLWVGTYGRGVTVWGPAGSVETKGLDALGREEVMALYRDVNGKMWMGSQDKGLAAWNPADSSLQFLRERKGLANDHVRCIVSDRWQNLWIGTSGGGISKYAGQQFEHYNKAANGFSGDYIYSVEAVGEDEVWVANSGKGVDHYINGKVTHYGVDSGFTDFKVKSLFQSRDSVIWLGTEGQGLFYFAQDTFGAADFVTGIGSNWIKSITEDQSGQLWVGTAGAGLCRIVRPDSLNGAYKYHKLNRSDGLKSDRFNAVLADRKGRIWFAYQSGGLGYITDDTLITDLSKTRGLRSHPIRSLALDLAGNIWLGTAGNGVLRMTVDSDSVFVASFQVQNGLSSDNIYLLEVDLDGHLWVGTERGVDRVDLDVVGNFLEVNHFGSDEGFLGVETSRNAVSTDPTGNIWFGTIDGLFKFKSGSGSTNLIPPELKITGVSLFYEPLKQTPYASAMKAGALPDTLALDYDWNQVTFDFKGVLLTQPAKIHYQWKLEGLEDKWSPLSTNRSITYSNLKPGIYNFMVRSMNEDGVLNELPESMVIHILTPIWMTAWFQWSVGALLALILSLLVRFRFKAVKRKAKAAQELLTMENEILVLEQKALRLQMNPHFIFNCLNTIQSMIVKKDDKTARYYLAKFSKLMRKTLDNSRSQRVLLEDEIETLDNYLSIEQFCSEDHFAYQINVADDIATDFIQLPPMIIQPFVENAIVHGVAHKKSGGLIDVRFSRQNGQLRCVIEDNGIGRKAAQQHKSSKEEQHKSTALIVTQERLERLQQDKGSQLIIEDLEDEKGNPSGTRVTVLLPYED